MGNSSMFMRNISRRQVILAFVAIVTSFASLPAISVAQSFTLEPLFSITSADTLGKLSMPSDVFVDDEHGEIYVVDEGNRRVVVFEMDGFYRYQFTVSGTSGGPTSLVVDSRGEILVAVGGKVAVCDFRGSILEYVDFYGFPGADKMNATRVEVDKNDNYYILDSFGRRVLVFDTNWDLKFTIDSECFPKNIRNVPHGRRQEESKVRSLTIGDICVDDEGMIYLVDVMTAYVYVFSPEGEYQRSIGEPGSAFTTLSFPNGVAVDNQGRILVVDSTGNALLGYDREGKLLFALGGLGKTQGRFYFPKYVSTDANGRIYVVEAFLGRIQVLTVELRPATVDTTGT